MGILDRFRRQLTISPSEAAPIGDAAAVATVEVPIPARNVRKSARWTKFDPNEYEERNIPAGLEDTDGPLGTEKPYSIVSEGFHKYVKNKRPGTELELTLQVSWVALWHGQPEDAPIIDVFMGGQQIGTMEMQRGGWFAPAVQLAQKYGVAMKASGVMAMWGDRREPFVFLPDPQKLYDYIRGELLKQIESGSRTAK